jgi:hypothetical protein
MPLAVVEALVELLDANPRQSLPQLGSYVEC